MYRSGQLGKDPSFLRAIVRSFGLGYSMLGLVALIHVSWNCDSLILGVIFRKTMWVNNLYVQYFQSPLTVTIIVIIVRLAS